MSAEINVRDLQQRIAAANPPVVPEGREPQEIAIARFPGAVEIPMHDVPGRLAELDPNQEIFVLCHHGMRTAKGASFLADQGFAQVRNVTGCIDAWALFVDQSVPRY